MNSGKTIFAQLMDFIPSAYEFRCCVERYHGNYKVKSFSCWNQFLTLAFAQLTYRESLRDIEACLRAAPQKLYHMGLCGSVSRNTLANANQVRDWRIYADFAHTLIQRGTQPLGGGTLWYRTQPDRLRIGCNDHRPMPITFPVGSIPTTQIGRQASHAARSARQYSYRGYRHGRTDPRSQHPRSVDLGSRRHLPDGPRLSRFPKTLPHASIGSFLCDSGQTTIRLSPDILPNRG